MRLRYFFILYLSMLFLLPFRDDMAAGGSYSHWHNWIYMFGHAGGLHYTLNGIGWLMMWKIATVKRTMAAWLLSVIAMYAVSPSQPVLGWSTIIYYYLGLCMNHAPRSRQVSLILLTLTGLLLPNIAAWLHLIMLAAGWIARKVEVAWERTE